MAFIRVKRKLGKSGNAYYGYLVENKWHKSRPRQRVIEYLGRVYMHEKHPKEYDSSKPMTYAEAIEDIIGWELAQHGTQGVTVDLKTKKILLNGKKAVLAMNNGYLCDYTLKKLLAVRHSEYEQEGYSLAKALVEAGIDLPKEAFVRLYEKIEKSGPAGTF